MSPLDELYTEYSHIKTVKEKGLLSLDWNANKGDKIGRAHV